MAGKTVWVAGSTGLVGRETVRALLAEPSFARVVAWTRREGQWLRWQSPPLATRGEVESAWLQADQWSRNPGDAERRSEVAITPLEEWQIFYFRADAWTNPLSSDAATAAGEQATPGSLTGGRAVGTIPDGVRLVPRSDVPALCEAVAAALADPSVSASPPSGPSDLDDVMALYASLAGRRGAVSRPSLPSIP